MAKGGLEGRAEVWVGSGSSRSGKLTELAVKPAPSDLVWGPPCEILSCRGCMGRLSPSPSPRAWPTARASNLLSSHCPAYLSALNALGQPLDDSCPKITNRK